MAITAALPLEAPSRQSFLAMAYRTVFNHEHRVRILSGKPKILEIEWRKTTREGFVQRHRKQIESGGARIASPLFRSASPVEGALHIPGWAQRCTVVVR